MVYFFCFLVFHQLTPLHLAVKSGRIEIVKHILDHEADVNNQDSDDVSMCVVCTAVVSIVFLV